MPIHPPPRVLLVEDHPDVIYLLRMLFMGWGWEPVVAEFEAAAMGLLDGHFDLVLLDLMLPDGNGINILRTLRQRPDPPAIVVSTGNDAPRVMDVVRSLNPDAIFVKPVHIDELQAFVDALKLKLRPLPS